MVDTVGNHEETLSQTRWKMRADTAGCARVSHTHDLVHMHVYVHTHDLVRMQTCMYTYTHMTMCIRSPEQAHTCVFLRYLFLVWWHTCNLRTSEEVAAGLWVLDQPELHGKAV